MNLLETNLGAGAFAKRRGKVRDIYDLGERLLLVATDRISAFDWVLPTAIPDKGRVLTGLSVYWFDLLKIPNHLITTDVDAAGLEPGSRQSARRSGAARWWCARHGSFRSSAWFVATFPGARGRSIGASGSVCGIALAPGSGRKPGDRADLHAGDQGPDAAMMRTFRSTSWPIRRQGSRENVTIDEPGGVSDRRRARRPREA